MTCIEGLSHLHSHPPRNQESAKGRGEAQKVGALSTPKNTNPRTKEMLRHKRPLPYSNPEITKEPKTKTKRGRKYAPRALLFHAKMCFTNEEEASLYRIWEGLV